MYKNFVRKNNISATILLFLAFFMVFIYFKPAFLFNKTGGFRHFGLGKTNSTIVPIWLLVILIAIICYVAVMYFLL